MTDKSIRELTEEIRRLREELELQRLTGKPYPMPAIPPDPTPQKWTVGWPLPPSPTCVTVAGTYAPTPVTRVIASGKCSL